MSRLLRYLRTLSAVNRMTRLVGPAKLARIETAVRDHTRAHPSGVEKMPRLLAPATLARMGAA
eukprot:7036379-Pyramimonas_sp.AAC.1